MLQPTHRFLFKALIWDSIQTLIIPIIRLRYIFNVTTLYSLMLCDTFSTIPSIQLKLSVRLHMHVVRPEMGVFLYTMTNYWHVLTEHDIL